MSKKHLPFSARLVETPERAFEILSSFKDPSTLRLLFQFADHYNPALKYRATAASSTFEGLVSLEVRSAEKDFSTKDKEYTGIPASEWLPMDNRILIHSNYEHAQASTRILSEEVVDRSKLFPLLHQYDCEQTCRVYIHKDTIPERMQDVRDHYAHISGHKRYWATCTTDEVTPDNGELKIDTDVTFIITPSGEVMVLYWLSVVSEGDDVLLVIFGDNFVSLIDVDSDYERWSRDDWYTLEKAMINLENYDYTRDFSMLKEKFLFNERLEELASLVFETYNHDLADPYVQEGDLDGEDTYFIRGSEDDLIRDTEYLLWALLPKSAWYIDGVETNIEDIIVPYYTEDTCCGDGAHVDMDHTYDMDWSTYIGSEATDILMGIFEETVLSDNYPMGHSYEYNDQDGNRMSGYSAYPNFDTISVPPPANEEAVARAKVWLEDNIRPRARDYVDRFYGALQIRISA